MNEKQHVKSFAQKRQKFVTEKKNIKGCDKFFTKKVKYFTYFLSMVKGGITFHYQNIWYCVIMTISHDIRTNNFLLSIFYIEFKQI